VSNNHNRIDNSYKFTFRNDNIWLLTSLLILQPWRTVVKLTYLPTKYQYPLIFYRYKRYNKIEFILEQYSIFDSDNNYKNIFYWYRVIYSLYCKSTILFVIQRYIYAWLTMKWLGLGGTYSLDDCEQFTCDYNNIAYLHIIVFKNVINTIADIVYYVI